MTRLRTLAESIVRGDAGKEETVIVVAQEKGDDFGAILGAKA